MLKSNVSKNICLVSSFIDYEDGISIVNEYDKKSLYSMLVKCYYHLHLLVDNRSAFVEELFIENCSLNIFDMNVSTSEPTKELIDRELLIFRRYQMNVKEINYPLKWWQKHESMFFVMGFHSCQILGIVGS